MCVLNHCSSGARRCCRLVAISWLTCNKLGRLFFGHCPFSFFAALAAVNSKKRGSAANSATSGHLFRSSNISGGALRKTARVSFLFPSALVGLHGHPKNVELLRI